MLTYVRQHHLALLALFVALGGTAFAAIGVGSNQVVDNSLRSRDLRDNVAVRSVDVVNGTLRSRDLRDHEGVKGIDIANRSIGGNDIAPNSITSRHVLSDTLSGADVIAGSLTGLDIAPDSVNGTDIDESSLAVAKVVKRIRETGDVELPEVPASAPYPLSSPSWTQTANEFQQAFASVEVVFPDGCLPNTAGFHTGERLVTVRLFLSGQPTQLLRGDVVSTSTADGENLVVPLVDLEPPPHHLGQLALDPDVVQGRTLVVNASSDCDAGDGERPVLSALRVDVVGYR